ncbi:unnamed protein product, partial [Mesorhabditis belari]|uniref:Uncharacterized protein n=1 Tax=Mesorhabditis belari TaxID=2138241 RepID=A0AAF3F2C2_9BILA
MGETAKDGDEKKQSVNEKKEKVKEIKEETKEKEKEKGKDVNGEKMMEEFVKTFLTQMDPSKRNEFFGMMKKIAADGSDMGKSDDASDSNKEKIDLKTTEKEQEEKPSTSSMKTEEKEIATKAEMIVAEAPMKVTMEEPQVINVIDTESSSKPTTSKDGEALKTRKASNSIIGIAQPPQSAKTLSNTMRSSPSSVQAPSTSLNMPMGPGTMAMLPNGQMMFVPSSALPIGGYSAAQTFVSGTVPPQGLSPSIKLGPQVVPSPTKAGSAQTVPIQRVEHKVPALQMVPPILPPTSAAQSAQHAEMLRRQQFFQQQQQLQGIGGFIGQSRGNIVASTSNPAMIPPETKAKLEQNLKEQQDMIMARIKDMYGGKPTQKQIQDHLGGPLLSIEQNGHIFQLPNPFYKGNQGVKAPTPKQNEQQPRPPASVSNQMSGLATATAFPQMVQPMNLAQSIGSHLSGTNGGALNAHHLTQMPQMIAQMSFPGIIPTSQSLNGVNSMAISSHQLAAPNPTMLQYPMMTPQQMQYLLAQQQQHIDRNQPKSERPLLTTSAEISHNGAPPTPQYIMIDPLSSNLSSEILPSPFTFASLALPTKLHDDCQCFLQSTVYQPPDQNA